jgi:anthranilate synthase component 2
MLVLIDNYDSFTYNLVHLFAELKAEVFVRRNDAIGVEDVINMRPEGIVISPGPCDPDRAGICLDLIARAAGRVPLLGVCLGHQSIGQAFGGRVVRAPRPMHGKVSQIAHDGRGLFAGVPSPFHATRYHSLMVAPEPFPSELDITGHSEDGVIQALQHRCWPVFGVQFHPESIATQHGLTIAHNFLVAAREHNAVTHRVEAAC